MSSASVDRRYVALRRERALDVSYDAFARGFESLLGRTDVDTLGAIAAAGPDQADAVREKLASFVGPSGFSLFQRIDHGGLLSVLAGRPTRAMTYVFGNALFAIEMTKHAPAVGLYVPLRLFAREIGPDRTVVTYDVPSSTLAQFGSPEVDAVAAMLDAKVEALVSDAAARAA